MPTRTINAKGTELSVGGLLLIAGIAALLGELNATTADLIVHLWPTGLIGMGLALFIKRP